MSAAGQFRLRSVDQDGRLTWEAFAASAEEAERWADNQLTYHASVDHCVIYRRDDNGFWQELTTARR